MRETRASAYVPRRSERAQLTFGSAAPTRFSSAAPPGSLTCFLNNMGHGVQFAALGALACERAKARGIGRSIPIEWLLQTVHS